MGDFNYNAPQFIDFTSPTELEQDFGEEYFDMNHEIEVAYDEISSENDGTYSEGGQSTHSDLSSYQNGVIIIDSDDESPQKLRRSVSAGHIILNSGTPKKVNACPEENSENALIKAFDNLTFKSAKKQPKIRRANGLSILPSKPLVMHSEKPKRLNKPQSISRDAIHKIGMSSNTDKLKRKMSVENLHSVQPSKYISLAEAIQRFQFGTPQRFHTKSNKTQFNSAGNAKMIALNHTIANSPALATKGRSRQTEYLGHDKQSQIEAAEMKKHQIKANPINYKILRTPVLPVKSENNVTQPEPFKFSEVKYQYTQIKEPPKEVYEFHARPVPKSTAPGAIPVIRRSIMPKMEVVKKPPTPTFRRKYQEDTVPVICNKVNNNKVNIKTVQIHHDGIQKTLFSQKPTTRKTHIMPFSFEERDRKMQEKKEEKIRKFLEDEKKAREFHARPIPSKVIGQCKKVESKVVKLICEGSSGSLKEHKGIDENVEPPQFKARPASVIHKKPFIPKKDERPLLEIQEFNLNTNHRAKEREEFDKKLKEKEEEFMYLKKEEEGNRKKIEEEEVKRLRKEIVHKANPIKAYKPIEILPSMKKVTSPKSPIKSYKRINETK